MRKHNLKEFELSQAYLFFWDKLEKANYFLEQMIDTADEDLEGRLVQRLLSQPVADGCESGGEIRLGTCLAESCHDDRRLNA